ncbi:MAG: hypothetical protein JW920_03170 [Deltaproteobacteria bacterium]|nr:hypothetical protein [Deltaproteobacteria bacterium]
MKNSRFELSHTDKVRRSIYVFLRDELERRLITIGLEEPYRTCLGKDICYPYVDPSEMKPKKKEFSKESLVAKPFFVIFTEDTIEEVHQKYIRFSESNKVRKDTIALVPDIGLHKSFYSSVRFFERDTFFEFLKPLLDVDYCILIQRDHRFKKRNRYSLTHFHVKIDWPISEAAEDLAKELRYISKSLYEKSERYADTLQQKLFEYYGFHHQASGGRRTAALIAAQYLKQIPGLGTVYISSSETRTITRYSEKGVARYAIIQLEKEYALQTIKAYNIDLKAFRNGYVLGESGNCFDLILFVSYKHTEWGLPPSDGKLRILKPDYSWLAVDKEMILPLPHAVNQSPLPIKWVYRS